MYEVRQDATKDGRNAFAEWTRRLRDTKARISVSAASRSHELGNFGDHTFCRDEVWELRVPLGPDYRIYYALLDTTIIVFLCGGDKKSQSDDVDRAWAHWRAILEGRKQ